MEPNLNLEGIESDHLICYFEDLLTGQVVWLGSPNHRHLFGSFGELDRLKPSLKTLDFHLLSPKDFISGDIERLDIRSLGSKDVDALKDFYKDVTEQEKIELSLSLGEDGALGLFLQNHLLGVARFYPFKSQPFVADVTILIRQMARGHRYAVPLVSRLIKEILRKKLIPCCKVGEDNLAGLAVAQRLGFTPTYRIWSWNITDAPLHPRNPSLSKD